MPGTNAKMNEFQALVGKEVLEHIDQIILKRSLISKLYKKYLADIPGIKTVPSLPQHITYNYAYMPIEVEEPGYGADRDSLHEQLKQWNVYTRRYFFPLTCDFSCYKDIIIKDPLPVARQIADRILSLPIYDSLALSDVEKICDIIRLIYYKKH